MKNIDDCRESFFSDTLPDQDLQRYLSLNGRGIPHKQTMTTAVRNPINLEGPDVLVSASQVSSKLYSIDSNSVTMV